MAVHRSLSLTGNFRNEAFPQTKSLHKVDVKESNID